MTSSDPGSVAVGLLAEIRAFVLEGAPDEARLLALARDLACLQFRRIPLYRALCGLRRVDPERIERLEDVPAAPSEAFKRAELHIAPDSVVRRFKTSGTTGGESRRGVACFSSDDLALMDAAIDRNAAHYLFPDGGRFLMLVLAPSPEFVPHMIMAYGMQRLVERYGTEGSGFLFGPNGLDLDALIARLRDARRSNTPVALTGASFGFVHLFDALRDRSLELELPPGSRALDAGGFKGKSREVRREDLIASFSQYLGLRPEYCVNLLGLTEFASQFYDDTLAAHVEGRPVRSGKQNPHWTKTWAIDPQTLSVLPHGEAGLLRHLDLSNGGHPFVVQTDDLGVTQEDGFTLLRRSGPVGSRGCSLTIDEIMESNQHEPA